MCIIYAANQRLPEISFARIHIFVYLDGTMTKQQMGRQATKQMSKHSIISEIKTKLNKNVQYELLNAADSFVYGYMDASMHMRVL